MVCLKQSGGVIAAINALKIWISPKLQENCARTVIKSIDHFNDVWILPGDCGELLGFFRGLYL